MAKSSLLIFGILCISYFSYGQRRDSTERYERTESPGYYLKRAGGDLIAGTVLSISSALLIVGSESFHNKDENLQEIMILLGAGTELFSLIEFISAGVNLRQAGKRMMHMKMGVSVNRVGLVLTL